MDRDMTVTMMDPLKYYTDAAADMVSNLDAKVVEQPEGLQKGAEDGGVYIRVDLWVADSFLDDEGCLEPERKLVQSGSVAKLKAALQEAINSLHISRVGRAMQPSSEFIARLERVHKEA